MKITIDVRPEVAAFALLIERQLRRNDHKGGWKNWGTDLWYAAKLMEETGELAKVMHTHAMEGQEPWPIEHAKEAGDVGAVAMMIADRSGALRQFMEAFAQGGNAGE